MGDKWQKGGSLVDGVPANLGFVYDLVCIGRTVFSIEVAEVGGFAVEIDDVGEVDGISDQSGGVHEVVGNFIAREEGHLHRIEVTMMGPMRLRLPVKLGENMINRQQISRLSRITKIFIRVMQKLPIMYSSGKVCLAVTLVLRIEALARQKGWPYMIVARCEYLLRFQNRSLWQQQKRLQQAGAFSSQVLRKLLMNSGKQDSTELKTMVPMWRNDSAMLGSRFKLPPPLSYPCFLELQYQCTAMDQNRKSEQDFKKPWVHSPSKSMRYMSGNLATSQCPLFCTIANLMNCILAKQAAMVTADSTMDTPNTQQLSQKHSFANFRDATMNFILCCFDRITTSEIRKPARNPTPHTNVRNEYLFMYDFWISVDRNGSRLPKKRYRKPVPSTSISSRHRGMQRQADTSGSTYVVSTMSMQTAAATPSPIRMSGITCQVDRQGMSWPLTLSIFSICSSVKWSAVLATSASVTTAAMSRAQSRQQNQSVQPRQWMGPSRLCTCSWISRSSYCIIIQITHNLPTPYNITPAL